MFSFSIDEDTGDSSDNSDSKTYLKVGNKEDDLNGEKKLAPPLSSTATAATIRVTEKDDCQKKTREFYGPNEHCYVMDAKSTGNIGRYLNVSCKERTSISQNISNTLLFLDLNACVFYFFI